MSDTKSTGRHVLKDSDFVIVENADGEDVYSVPKHWGDDLIPDGLKKTSRKPGSAKSSSGRTPAPSGDEVKKAVEEAAAKAKADAEATAKAEIERLTKELEAAKKASGGK